MACTDLPCLACKGSCAHLACENAAGEKKGRKERLAELLDFADEHLITDKGLAQQHAPHRSTEGLHSRQYWVTAPLQSCEMHVFFGLRERVALAHKAQHSS